MTEKDIEAVSEIGAIKASHVALDRRVAKLEEKMSGNLEKIYGKLERLGNRPSWLTTSIIAFLSSGFFAMLTIILMGPQK